MTIEDLVQDLQGFNSDWHGRAGEACLYRVDDIGHQKVEWYIKICMSHNLYVVSLSYRLKGVTSGYNNIQHTYSLDTDTYTMTSFINFMTRNINKAISSALDYSAVMS